MRFLFVSLYCLSFYLSLVGGFPAGTLIKTPNGHEPIEHLSVDSVVCCAGSKLAKVVSTCHTPEQHYFCLILDKEKIIASDEQRFYLPREQAWRSAQEIKPGDALLDDCGRHLIIQEVIACEGASDFFDISLEEPHTYYVTKSNILAHNFGPVVFGVAAGVPVVVGAARAAVLGLATFFAKHVKLGNGRASLGGSACPQPRPPQEPEDEDPEEWKKKHPHGKHDGASYHHANCHSRKGKAPKDGQQALDNSFHVKNEGTNNELRVGVSEGEFVVLRQSGEQGKFHGYVCEWRNLRFDCQRTLIKEGVVNLKGKILCKR